MKAKVALLAAAAVAAPSSSPAGPVAERADPQ
jgi:hypothetical protein